MTDPRPHLTDAPGLALLEAVLVHLRAQGARRTREVLQLALLELEPSPVAPPTQTAWGAVPAGLDLVSEGRSDGDALAAPDWAAKVRADVQALTRRVAELERAAQLQPEALPSIKTRDPGW